MSSSPAKLFKPIELGRLTLQTRVVLCPMTRYKATKKEHVPVVPLVGRFYSQRGSHLCHPGTLLITEGVFVSPKAGGYDYVPGIWSQAQIDAWKQITAGVHEQGSHIYLQLWSLGRAASAATLKGDGLPFVAPSPIGLSDSGDTPRELSVVEMAEYVKDHAQAAKNAIEAGFDGVEIHCANGYLPNQYLHEKSNQRTDNYGGSIENRSRFPLEIVKAVAEAVGEDRTGVRISPWGTYQDMMSEDPIPQYAHFISSIKAAHPNFAYLHVVEPVESDRPGTKVSNDPLREIWLPKPFISASGFLRETAIAMAEKNDGNLIAFGQLFISNPDLVTRLKNDSPLNPYNSSTFYVPSDRSNTEEGYIDYPFHNEGQISEHV